MLKKINKNEIFVSLIFIIGFSIFLFWNLSNNIVAYDRMWTFHMTQKIAMGELPYSEINIIITPFFYQLGAVLFNLFGRADFVAYSVYAGIIGGFLSLISYKLIEEVTQKESMSFFASLFCIFILSTFAETNYNTLLLFFILWAMYLEIKKEKSDRKQIYNILLGIALGLCAATKHTVGGVVLITSIIISLLKKCILKENVLKEIAYKILGVCVVGIPYLVWLIFNGILDEFLDLAIFGMLDFAEKNTSGSFFNCVFFVNIVVIYSTFLIFNYFKENGEKNKSWLIMRNICTCGNDLCNSYI
ncbi:MAG: glycosyltransferase family 39 protein [Clostridia bacterium]|nr:glycosyltransferase family 39 protein [Clostridia bacterium]